MARDEHDHDQDHGQDPPSDMALRLKALKTVLVEKVWSTPPPWMPSSITTSTRSVPERRAGGRQAMDEPDFRARLMDDAAAAIAELGYTGRQGEHMVVENTPEGAPPRQNPQPCTRSVDPRRLLPHVAVVRTCLLRKAPEHP